MVVKFFSRNYHFIRERERDFWMGLAVINELIGDAIAKL